MHDLGWFRVTRIAYLIRREFLSFSVQGPDALSAENIVPNERTFIFETEKKRHFSVLPRLPLLPFSRLLSVWKLCQLGAQLVEIVFHPSECKIFDYAEEN